MEPSLRYETIAVRVSDTVLESDEAIWAILAHEAFELKKLEALFDAQETISMQRFARLVNDRVQFGQPENLHEQAWDEANRLVVLLRKGELK